MDYDVLVKKIGEFGRYQTIFVTWLSVASVLNAVTSFEVNFIFGKHDHRCMIPGLRHEVYTKLGSVWVNGTRGQETYNISECTIEINGSITKCNKWVYDQSIFEATLISKYDIVCDDQIQRAHFLTSHYIGSLVGSIVTGLICDTVGRKPALLFGMAALLIATGVRPFLQNYTVVVLMEFVNGLGSIVVYIAPFVLIIEMVGPEKRLLGSFLLYFLFCFGSYVLLLLAYMFRDWTHLLWAIATLIGGYTISVFFIPESPRWLITRGQRKEAFVILKRMSKFNKTTASLSEEEIKVTNQQDATFLQLIKALVTTKQLILRLSIMSLNWFAICLTYYGIAMSVAKFPGDLFVNFAISSSGDLVAVIFCWMIGNRLGHKTLYCSAMILSSFACIFTIVTTVLWDHSQDWLVTTLSVVGRGIVTVGFFTAYVYTSELFPTVLRASALGVCSMFARLGSICSAYISELGSITHKDYGMALPLFIFGVIGLIAGLLTFALPETANMTLPETIEDVKMVYIRSDLDVNGEEKELEMLTLESKMDSA